MVIAASFDSAPEPLLPVGYFMKRTFLKIGVLVLVMVVLGIILRMTFANRKEIKILSVKIGSNRWQVEELLGSGGNKKHTSCTCEQSPMQVSEDHYAYRGNGSLWYGRFEDYLNICYSDNVVCGMYRSGL